MRQPTSNALLAAPHDAGEQRPATGDQPAPSAPVDLGLRCPRCKGEGYGEGKTVDIFTYDLGATQCVGCDLVLSVAEAIALWSRRRGKLAEEQVELWRRFAHLVALARRPTPTLPTSARMELRVAALSLRDAIAAVNATEEDDDDDGGDDGRAYEAQCAAEKAFVAAVVEHGVEGVIMDGRIYAGFGADVARVEVLQDSYVLDLATVVSLDE